MHEASLVRSLIRQAVAHAEGEPILVIRLAVGPSSHHRPADIRDRFELLAQGTPAADARLSFQQPIASDDPEGVRLISIEVAD